MNRKTLRDNILILCLFILTSAPLFAQSDIASPYTRFGIGDVRMQRGSTAQIGMGGFSSTLRGNTIVNPNSAASYAFIDSLSFIFETGFYYKTAKCETSALSENSSNASLDHANIAFSITKHWKAGLGISPLSNTDYEVIIPTTNIAGSFKNSFIGEGGLNEVYFNNGFRLLPNLALGVEANYIFGNIDSETTIYFPDSTYFLNGRRTYYNKIGDFRFGVSGIYTIPLKKEWNLSLGFNYKFKSDLNTKQTVFIRNMFLGYEDYSESPIDTLQYIKDRSSSLTLPQYLTAGFSFEKGDRLVLGADFSFQNWDGFKFNGKTDSIQNAWSVNLGASYRGSSSLASPYSKRITYRAGFHYDRSYYKIYGADIDKIAISVGMSLPFPRSYTNLDIAIELGQFGTTKNNLIKESYIQFSVGMTIHEKWFVKRKYK